MCESKFLLCKISFLHSNPIQRVPSSALQIGNALYFLHYSVCIFKTWGLQQSLPPIQLGGKQGSCFSPALLNLWYEML